MRWPGTLAVGVVVALLFPTGVGAAPTWLPPVTVSPPGEENEPAGLGVGPEGTVIAVWQRATCTQQGENEECKDGRIFYSARSPGGSFSAPATISGDPGPVNITFPPSIAFDGAGNAIAVWTSGAGTASRVRYSLRPSGGEFGPALPIDNGGNEGFFAFPDVAMAANGRAVVTFQRTLEGKSEAGYAIRPPGGAFGAAKAMIGDPGAGNINQAPSVQMSAAGEAIANWTSTASLPMIETAVRYAILPAAADQFSETQKIEPGSTGRVAEAPSGAAVMVWSPLGVHTEVRYAFRAPGGPFGSPQSIPDPDNPGAPRVAIAADGSAVAAWTAGVGDELVRWAAAPPGGPFGPPLPMPEAGNDATLMSLAGSEGGAALALWLDSSNPLVRQVRASLRPPGSAFGAPTTLPSPPQGADLFGAATAFDAEGNAAALWHGLDRNVPGPHDVPLLAAGLDAAGPRITLQAPAKARQGRPVKISLGATDVWSGIASTRIEFGDGKGAPGPEASHRYAPGAFTLTGFATDAVGNSSSVQSSLRISNARPLLSGLRVVPKSFPAASSPKASRKGGASIRFRLSERATLRLTVKRKERHGRTAKAAGKRLKTVGKVVFRNRRAGRNRVRFSGRVKGHALAGGKYVLVGVAVDRTKKRSRPRKAGFQVLSPAR
jgi:hypothetical protein